MIVFPIRSCARPEFVRARRGRGFFSTQRLQICEDWVLSTQSSPAVCAFGGWSRPEDGCVRGIFLARIWVGATPRGFSLHRDRGFVEIGFYLHRDCRYIGPCGAIIFSPRFARTRRGYVYMYTIEINISNIHHKIFEAWKTFFPKKARISRALPGQTETSPTLPSRRLLATSSSRKKSLKTPR